MVEKPSRMGKTGQIQPREGDSHLFSQDGHRNKRDRVHRIKRLDEGIPHLQSVEVDPYSIFRVWTVGECICG